MSGPLTILPRVYLSGPISLDGRATPAEIEENIQRFHDEQARLAADGWDVLSPLENGLRPDSAWPDHMRADIAMLMQADEIHMLPRWEESRGATLELFIATQVGIPSRFIASRPSVGEAQTPDQEKRRSA